MLTRVKLKLLLLFAHVIPSFVRVCVSRRQCVNFILSQRANVSIKRQIIICTANFAQFKVQNFIIKITIQNIFFDDFRMKNGENALHTKIFTMFITNISHTRNYKYSDFIFRMRY